MTLKKGHSLVAILVLDPGVVLDPRVPSGPQIRRGPVPPRGRAKTAEGRTSSSMIRLPSQSGPESAASPHILGLASYPGRGLVPTRDRAQLT